MTHQRGATQVTGRKHYHHGRTPAAWVGSLVTSIGFIIGSIGFLMNINWVVVWAGAALVVLGVIAAGVMVKLGYGQG